MVYYKFLDLSNRIFIKLFKLEPFHHIHTFEHFGSVLLFFPCFWGKGSVLHKNVRQMSKGFEKPILLELKGNVLCYIHFKQNLTLHQREGNLGGSPTKLSRSNPR